MRRGKEEMGSSEPLFPRLNVNDRDIGGPRAPPRNKMALYEQLTVPSPRLIPTSISNQNRSTYTSSDALYLKSPLFSERTHQQSLDNTTLNTKIIQSGRSFKKLFKNSVVADRSIRNSQLQLISSHGKKSLRNLDEENDKDLKVPPVVRSNITSFGIENSSTLSRNINGKLLKASYIESLNKIENTATLDGVRCFIDINVVDEEDKSQARENVCSKEDELTQQCGNKANDLQENEVVINEISDASLSATMIGPDDVVELIGPKHFWKARKAIVDQQRVFAMQVFELHRLIKVQKSLAASPDTIKVDIIINPSPDITTPENFNQTNQQTFIQEVSTQNLNMVRTAEQNSTPDAHINIASSQWCYPPNSNQWLMPVMSPSEGLIYKPYPGPCPPPTDYTPFYGHPNPMNFPVLPTYNVQYQLPPHMCYPLPYILPFTNPMEQSSMQSSLLVEKQPSDFSCNLSKQTSKAVTSQVQKGLAPKNSDLQGSQNQHRGSSCANEVSDDVENVKHNRVIRVVPHKAVLATESAARIFRSIQEERKNYES